MKFKEIEKMEKKELDKKMKELNLELVKSKAGTSKTVGGKTKQIKKIIARIKTLNNSKQENVDNK